MLKNQSTVVSRQIIRYSGNQEIRQIARARLRHRRTGLVEIDVGTIHELSLRTTFFVLQVSLFER